MSVYEFETHLVDMPQEQQVLYRKYAVPVDWSLDPDMDELMLAEVYIALQAYTYTLHKFNIEVPYRSDMNEVKWLIQYEKIRENADSVIHAINKYWRAHATSN